MKHRIRHHYSDPQKKKVVDFILEDKIPVRQVSEITGIKAATIYQWLHKAKAEAGITVSDLSGLPEESKNKLVNLAMEIARLTSDREEKLAAFKKEALHQWTGPKGN